MIQRGDTGGDGFLCRPHHMRDTADMDFHGAKLAILVRDRIVTILRDDRPDLPWPGHWDLPGGGREGEETAEACVLRELREELGLRLSTTDLHWKTRSASPQGGYVWFFVSELPELDITRIEFGNEGQEWRLASLDWFMSEARTIPHHRARLETYLAVAPRRQ